MLDQETKRKIDNARDILVGKVPDPKSQVEQITIALIYKFMDDMDKESVEWGGKPTFFTGEYEKYAWSKIFDPRLGGYDLIGLYGDAIVRMNQNPNIPQLFRDIFKNAYLPYRDPETLKSFLKEINEFTYDHSERLGDAFEYLLSAMDSQGEAGQFRTPRHIIDFIVEIVDPKKNQTVLDPACGTAGFLISSYKHILKANTKHLPGDQLTPDEKKRVMTNFTGYDISPDMVRLSLVNLYLHGFSNPKIHEYDTLTSEERWNETSDVVLANPPFMTPKGGIRPHKRFSIQAKRSEVLFVDYIAEHLNPNGRAGVIVPEGIIFQSQNAYKNLRKMLVENYLWSVVSLPAGLFNPYSGVKTSVLLMDRTLSKKTDKILFVKIENDGFGLGAQRRPIDKNDLPQALELIKTYKQAVMSSMEVGKTDLARVVKKSRVAESGDWNLSGERYATSIATLKSDYEWACIEEIAELFVDGDWVETKDQSKEGIRLIQTGNIGFGEYVDKPENARFITDDKFNELRCTEVYAGDVLVSRLPDPVGRSCLAPTLRTRMIAAVDCTIIRFNKEKMIPSLFVHYTKNDGYYANIVQYLTGSSRQRISRSNLAKVQVPLPPLDVQKAIVAEVDSYQKIVDGARQVIENYKPTIKIDPDWEMVELGEICKMQYGYTESGKDSGDARFVRITDIDESGKLRNVQSKFIDLSDDSKPYLLRRGDLVVARTGATYGKTLYFDETFPAVFASYLIRLDFTHDKIMNKYYWVFAQSKEYESQKSLLVQGGGQPQFNANVITKVRVPLPPLKTQKQIVAQIDSEQKMVDANKKLIGLFEGKIKAKIKEVCRH